MLLRTDINLAAERPGVKVLHWMQAHAIATMESWLSAVESETCHKYGTVSVIQTIVARSRFLRLESFAFQATTLRQLAALRTTQRYFVP